MAPQRGWSAKDERQYEHIKQSAEERGESQARAEEIAARTANKQRREEGRTRQQQNEKNRRNGQSGPSRPASPSGGHSLSDMTRDELYQRARELDIACRSNMNKDELLEAIRSHSN